MDQQPTTESVTRDKNRTMQEACISGDLSTIQELLQTNTQQPPSNIHSLLSTAVTSQNPAVVTYILSTYPTVSLSQHTDIVRYLLSSNDIPMLRLLLAHDPRFASISLDSGMRCFITDACFCPPSQIEPLIHILLDAGADVNDGLGPGGGTLLAALQGGQSGKVIAKTVEKGGYVSRAVVCMAVERERVDVLPLLLRLGGGKVKKDELTEWAEKSGSKEVMRLIETYVSRGNSGVIEFEKDGKGERRYWWEPSWASRK